MVAYFHDFKINPYSYLLLFSFRESKTVKADDSHEVPNLIVSENYNKNPSAAAVFRALRIKSSIIDMQITLTCGFWFQLNTVDSRYLEFQGTL